MFEYVIRFFLIFNETIYRHCDRSKKYIILEGNVFANEKHHDIKSIDNRVY